jgi:hypothetical protein
MKPEEILLPTVDDYARALLACEPTITVKQRELLRLHHAAPARVASATRLAELVGYDGYTGVNLQYGKLAAAIGDALGIRVDPRVAVGLLVEFVSPDFVENAHWLWVLRPNVAQALEQIGWVPRVSHMLYPADAMPA